MWPLREVKWRLRSDSGRPPTLWIFSHPAFEIPTTGAANALVDDAAAGSFENRADGQWERPVTRIGKVELHFSDARSFHWEGRAVGSALALRDNQSTARTRRHLLS